MGLVVAENITKIYSVVATKVSKDCKVGEIATRALNEVSFEIQPASFVSFVGPSGNLSQSTLLPCKFSDR
jgi:ABC-type lipoprotein export system ATPase subunit